MTHSPQPPDDLRPDVRRTALKVLALALCAVALALLGTYEPFRRLFSMESMKRLVERLGAFGPFAILMLGLVTPLLFLPRWPLCVVCGLLYGVLQGALLATVASLLGAVLQFRLARSLLAGMARRILAHSRLSPARLPTHHAFAALFLLRLFPLSNFVATNLLAGTIRMRTGPYIAATFLGMLPSSVMYAAWGKFVKRPHAGLLLLIFAVLLALAGGAALLRRRGASWAARKDAAGRQGAD